MFICNECGNEFEFPAELKETHPEIPPPNVRYYHGCPRCGESDYREVPEDE